MRKATSGFASGVAAVCLLGLASCSDMDTTQQRMLSGGAIGAGVGAVGTVMTGGCVACGAAIGAGVGAVGGYVYDQVEKNNNSKTGSSYNSSGSGYQGSGQ